MKNCNLQRYVLALLVIVSIFISTISIPLKAADAAWSALQMPQPVGTVVDMAVSPNQDGLVFLLAFDNGFNLWRTLNDGVSWQRVYQTNSAGLSSIDRFTVAKNGTLFVAGSSTNGPDCLKSIDNGQTFTEFHLPVSIDSTAGFVALNDQNFFFTSFDGSRSRVWRTLNGTTFDSTVISSTPLSLLYLSPNFTTDNTLVAAGADGNVYISTSGGLAFTALQQSPLIGEICLAFSGDYSSSKYIYAASASAGSGIWRMKVGEPSWTRVDAGLPSGTMVSGLAVSPSGVIYGASANQVSSSNGGLIRKTVINPTWESARDSLQSGTTLWGIQEQGNKLYSLDTTNNRIVTYTDTLASPVELISPAPAAPGIGTFSSSSVGNIDITWRNPGGASSFQWQLSDIADISVVRFEGTTATETTRLKGLDPGTTYYWRVRATGPLSGPWSTVLSFTTALGAPVLTTPALGVTVQIMLPPFQWQPATGAKSYELMLSTTSDFHILTASVTSIGGNAWQPLIGLLPSTGYFWKVRAIGTNTSSPWSAVSAFTTSAPATTTVPPTTTLRPSTTPPPTSTAPPTTTSQPTTTATSSPPATTHPLDVTTSLPPSQTSFAVQTTDKAGANPIVNSSTIPAALIIILVGMGFASFVVVSLIIKTRDKSKDKD